MGTVGGIRSRKKDDIDGTSNYQLQGHLTIIFNVLFSFSISERTDVEFFWYEYIRG
jgi:hypothetical protein